jgi:hypothetical protein
VTCSRGVSVCGVQELQEAVKKVVAGDREAAAEVRRVRREVVDLHGEMVLLLNYSAINYTGWFGLAVSAVLCL